jgi:hypothetical protein
MNGEAEKWFSIPALQKRYDQSILANRSLVAPAKAKTAFDGSTGHQLEREPDELLLGCSVARRAFISATLPWVMSSPFTYAQQIEPQAVAFLSDICGRRIVFVLELRQ